MHGIMFWSNDQVALPFPLTSNHMTTTQMMTDVAQDIVNFLV